MRASGRVRSRVIQDILRVRERASEGPCPLRMYVRLLVITELVDVVSQGIR